MKEKRPIIQEAMLKAMKKRGLDTEGVTAYCPYPGTLAWVVKNDEVIGTYIHRSRELIMAEDVLKQYYEERGMTWKEESEED